MFRCTVIAILAGAGLRKMGHPLLGTPKVRLLVMARAVIGYFALSTYFYRSFSPLLSFIHSFVHSAPPSRFIFPCCMKNGPLNSMGLFILSWSPQICHWFFGIQYQQFLSTCDGACLEVVFEFRMKNNLFHKFTEGQTILGPFWHAKMSSTLNELI
jgi:hypothetical protein